MPRMPSPPAGFCYRADFLDHDEERKLLERIPDLPLKNFEFQGYLAKRRVIYFGWQYSYGQRALQRAEEIPSFLLGLRERAASIAELPPDDLVHAMIAEYAPGTAIGWHRDKAVFGDVIGVSLNSACVFRFRRRTPSGWDRYSLTAEPRSVYLLRGAARTEWEHSIPAVAALRYSITFRSLR